MSTVTLAYGRTGLPVEVPDSAQVITPVPGKDLSQAPTQVKIRVPLTTLDPNAEACGFVVSLGWSDPHAILARKVKHCTVSVTRVSGRKVVRERHHLAHVV